MENINNLVNIHYLIDSEECLLLDNLAKLDDPNMVEPVNFFDKCIFHKLFKEIDKKTETYFVKNKYLYYLTGGALNYLEAIYSMQKEVKEIDDFEIKSINTLIAHHGIEINDYDFVSLGCGEGKKDFDIIEKIFRKNNNLTYYPVDISPHLLQLTINKFKHKLKNNKININALNCDFYDFDKNFVNIKKIFSIDKPKIYTLLGGTIGNYKETGLLDQISKLMNENEYLFISFELYIDKAKLSETIQKYYTYGNIEFLINPMKLIPRYKGYLENRTKYFKLVQKDFSYNEFVTDVDGSASYTPFFKIPNNARRIFIAWSTRYLYRELLIFLNCLKDYDYVGLDTDDQDTRCVALLKKKALTKTDSGMADPKELLFKK